MFDSIGSKLGLSGETKELTSEIRGLRDSMSRSDMPSFYKSEGAAGRPLTIGTHESFRDALQISAFKFGVGSVAERQLDETKSTNELLKDIRDSIKIDQTSNRASFTEDVRRQFGLLGVAEVTRAFRTMPESKYGSHDSPENLEAALHQASLQIAQKSSVYPDDELLFRLTHASSARKQSELLLMRGPQLPEDIGPVDISGRSFPNPSGLSDEQFRKLVEISEILRGIKGAVDYAGGQNGNTSRGQLP